ncbi:hypothetical protein Leryth_017780 [Lithospermum erythrorhizon]|nr:hypothetical protein Leryth_017780 [Lithospermum erythrorhizon]
MIINAIVCKLSKAVFASVPDPIPDTGTHVILLSCCVIFNLCSLFINSVVRVLDSVLDALLPIGELVFRFAFLSPM